MIFDSLAPGESLGCEVLSIADLPNVLAVRSDQSVARVVNMAPQRVVANWFLRLRAFLVFAGIVGILYLLIVLTQFLVLKTPAP